VVADRHSGNIRQASERAVLKGIDVHMDASLTSKLVVTRSGGLCAESVVSITRSTIIPLHSTGPHGFSVSIRFIANSVERLLKEGSVWLHDVACLVGSTYL